MFSREALQPQPLGVKTLPRSCPSLKKAEELPPLGDMAKKILRGQRLGSQQPSDCMDEQGHANPPPHNVSNMGPQTPQPTSSS